MKKVITAFLIICAMSPAVFSQQVSEISLRFSYQNNMMRIVLESDKDTIEKANSIASLSDLKIEFPSQFILKKQKDFMFEMFKHDRLLVIQLRNIIDIKVFKLDSPSRIVIDLTSREPIDQLSAQLPPRSHRVHAMVLDAGHGGYDYGIESMKVKEKDMNLMLTNNLRNILLKKGHAIHLTRTTDQAVTIADRIHFANSKNPDVFISMHASLSDNFVVYTSPIEDIHTDITIKLYSQSYRQNRHIEKSRTLAFAIGKSLKKTFKKNVLFREMPLPLLNSMDAPAILLEAPILLFSDYDDSLINKVTDAIREGINAYAL